MSKIDIILILLLNLIWGCSFTFIGYAVLFYAPAFLYALRLLSTGLLTVGFNKFPKKYIKHIIAMSFLQAFLFYGIGLSVKNIDSSTTAILTRLDILFTIILSSIFFKEKIKVHTIFGMVICFYAVYIISGDISLSNLKYVFLMLLSALASGINNIIAKTIKDINSKTIVSWSSLFIGIIMLLISITVENPLIIKPLNFMSIMAIIYLGIFSSYFAYVGLYYLLRKYDAGKIMPYNFTRPIFSLLFGFLILNEPITSRKVVGISMIIVGIAVSEFYYNKRNFFIKLYRNIKIYYYKKIKSRNVEYTSQNQ